MPICVFDLDRTLYDVDALKKRLFHDVETLGIPRDQYETAYRETSERGFSLEAWLEATHVSPEDQTRLLPVLHAYLADGLPYLLPGVSEGMGRLSKHAECRLLTYGFPAYQQEKMSGLGSFRQFFAKEHYVWSGETKGDILFGLDTEHTIFLDDSARFLSDVQQKAPNVRCVRMSSAHVPAGTIPEDGSRWPVVTSFAAFEELVAPWLAEK